MVQLGLADLAAPTPILTFFEYRFAFLQKTIDAYSVIVYTLDARMSPPTGGRSQCVTC